MAFVIRGKALKSWEEAVGAVLEEANAPPIPLKVINCFTFLQKSYDDSELQSKAQDFIIKILEKEFGENSKHSEYSWWYVPVPTAKYIRGSLPQLRFSIAIYIAAPAGIHYLAMDGYSQGDYSKVYPCTVIGKFIKEATEFAAPLTLLKALAEGDNIKYEVAGKELYWTSWDVCGFEARIPDTFASMIKGLNSKSIAKSIEDLKIVGSGISQLLDKGLLATPSAIFNPSSLSVSSTGNYQEVVTCLKEQMGYPEDKAEKAAKYVMDKFPQAGLEEKIKKALIYLGG